MTDRTSLSEFTSLHQFTIPEHMRDDEVAVIWLSEIKSAVDKAMGAKSTEFVAQNEPTWAMLWSMLDRVYEHTAAASVSFFTGGWASMEVIVRAVLESSITVIYVSQADRNLRLGQYLGHYFVSARKAIEKCEQWGGADSARHDLEFRERLIKTVAANDGIPLSSTGWPASVFERFKAVGMEQEYRHLYAVLSSQAHNDADALIDFVIMKSMDSIIPDAEKMMFGELMFWIRFYLYSALRFYALAAQHITHAFTLDDASDTVKHIGLALNQRLTVLSRDFQDSVKANKAS